MKRIRVVSLVRFILLWTTLAAGLAQAADAVLPAAPPAALRNASTRAERQFEAALQLAADNQVDAAMAAFARLTRDYPRLPEPYQQLAALHAKRGNLQQAVAALRTALSLSVQDAQLQEQLGDLYLQLAAAAYHAALQADNPSASARNKYSIVQSVTPTPVPPSAHPP